MIFQIIYCFYKKISNFIKFMKQKDLTFNINLIYLKSIKRIVLRFPHFIQK